MKTEKNFVQDAKRCRAFAFIAALLAFGGMYGRAQHAHSPSAGEKDKPMEMNTMGVEAGAPGHAMESDQRSEKVGVHGRNPVVLDQRQRQLINVRTTPATMGPAVVELRTVGIISYDQTAISNVNTRIMGWAEKLYVDKPGQYVQAGAPLMDIYSPELYSAQSEYLLAYRHCERLGHLEPAGASQDRSVAWQQSMKDSETLLNSARKRLKLWDVTDEEIDALEESGTPSDTVQLRAPATGYVIEKNIDPAQMVRPGMTLYRIADLSTVWVNADIYEYELPLVEAGQKAVVTTIAQSGRAVPATVDFIYPYSDSRTRTTQVRLVMDNSDGRLKPDTYVNVEIMIDQGERLLIPDSAVFDTGTRQYVFIEESAGFFVPRAVELGAKVGRMFSVSGGVMPGESVVVDGNFLLDSESQLSASGSGGSHNH
ncbi:MAG: efflux RND transporter periplasmic adaptor subunit [Opitutaceae bacterium]